MIKHFTASAIIIYNHKVLLLWHSKLKTWLYPGGHLEINESPDDAVKREVREETGLEVNIIRNNSFCYRSETVKTLSNPLVVFEELVQDHIHIDFVYLCSAESDRVVINKDESKKFLWAGRDELNKLEIYDDLKELLLNILNDDT